MAAETAGGDFPAVGGCEDYALMVGQAGGVVRQIAAHRQGGGRLLRLRVQRAGRSNGMLFGQGGGGADRGCAGWVALYGDRAPNQPAVAAGAAVFAINFAVVQVVRLGKLTLEQISTQRLPTNDGTC